MASDPEFLEIKIKRAINGTGWTIEGVSVRKDGFHDKVIIRLKPERRNSNVNQSTLLP